MQLHTDVDLLLVGDLGFAEAIKLLYPAQQELGREINPKLYSPDEWKKALAGQSGFIKQLLTDPLLPIVGNMDDVT